VGDTARRFCGTLVGDGRPGPIEERIGRRLVRLVDPLSDEGVRLLAGGEVELVGPDGEFEVLFDDSGVVVGRRPGR